MPLANAGRAADHLRMRPPFTTSTAEIDQLIDAPDCALAAVFRELS